MKTTLLRLYTWVSMAVFVLVMLLLYPLMVWPVKRLGEKGRRASHLGFRLWGHVFYLFGIRFQAKGREDLVSRGPVLSVANHNSFLDSPAAFVAIPRPFRVLGKVEMTRLPVFGSAYKVACLLVDRGKASSRSASLIAITRELRKGGAVLVFPEGSMNKGAKPLYPFQVGTFQLAHRMGIPVQPICFTGTQRLLPGFGAFLMRPGRIGVHISPALDPKEFETAEALMEASRLWISSFTPSAEADGNRLLTLP